MKKSFLIITIALLSINCIYSQTKKDVTDKTEINKDFAKAYDYVNDFEKILTPTQITTLNTTLKSFEKKALYKIIIVTTSSAGSYVNFSEYSQALDKYLTTDLKTEPSVLIVVSKQMRQIQVLGSSFIKYKLDDSQTTEIISNYTVPEFKKGNYYKGMEDSVTQIMQKLEAK
jgi:uncharacterized protein